MGSCAMGKPSTTAITVKEKPGLKSNIRKVGKGCVPAKSGPIRLGLILGSVA